MDTRDKVNKTFPIFSTTDSGVRRKKFSAEKQSKKGRTPSGQPLSINYDSVRDFFSCNSLHRKRKRDPNTSVNPFTFTHLTSAIDNCKQIEDGVTSGNSQHLEVGDDIDQTELSMFNNTMSKCNQNSEEDQHAEQMD